MIKTKNNIQFKSQLYDLIKIATTLIVVLGHITRIYTGQSVIIPVHQSILLLKSTEFIYSFHMPLFMIMSGAVYCLCIHDLKKYSNKKSFFLTKLKRLLLPYIIFGSFYVAPIMIFFKFSDMNYVEYIIKGIIIPTQSRHLWFILYLLIFQLYTYFILNNTIKLKTLITSEIFFLIIYIFNIPLISNISYFLFFFLMGYILNLYITEKYQLGMIIFGFLVCIIMYSLSQENNYIDIIIALISSFTITNIFKIFINKLDFIVNLKAFKFLKKNSMGIYLFHPMIIYIIYYYFESIIDNVFVFVILVFIISILISIILTYIVRFLKLKSVIGE